MNRRRRTWSVMRPAMLVLTIGTLAGCIQVRAPDKPIEINLNVKIQQDVYVHVVEDAKQLIDDQPELFPK